MTEQDRQINYTLNTAMANTEIMTIEQFKEFKSGFDNVIFPPCRGVPQNVDMLSTNPKDWKQGDKRLCWAERPYCSPADSNDILIELNKCMNKFIVMQKQEKIVWALNSKYDGQSNILLTNKGKILYIKFILRVSQHSCEKIREINYEIINHNFDIPVFVISTLKVLIKNIRGQHITYRQTESPFIDVCDFNSIYKNINEYLEEIKKEQLEQEQLEQAQLEQAQLEQAQLEQAQAQLEQAQSQLEQEQFSESEDENCLL